MLGISLVIFDMDGLMFDTERISVSAWQKAGERFGFDISPNIVLETLGLDLRKTEGVYRRHLGDSFPFSEAREFRIEYANRRVEESGVPVKEGLYELLEYLSAAGIPKAVATSTERARAEKYLTLAGVRDRFEAIVCGEDVEKGKPEPDIFLAAAQRLGIDPADCMVLEDSENGLTAAWKAGMRPLFVPDLRRPSPDVMARVFREFESLLRVRDYFRNHRGQTGGMSL